MANPYLETRNENPTPAWLATTLVERSPSEQIHVVDLPWRLSSWAWPIPEQTKFWSTPNGDVLAWACLQTPFWSLDFAVPPDAPPEITTAVLTWANDRAQALVSTHLGRPLWFAFAFADQPEVIGALQANGFQPQTTA